MHAQKLDAPKQTTSTIKQISLLMHTLYVENTLPAKLCYVQKTCSNYTVETV